MEILDDFAKAKGLPPVSRVVGGPVRRVYYERPDRIRVIRGLNVPFESVGRLGVEAERRGMTNVELAEELGFVQESKLSLPARAGHTAIELMQRLRKA